MQHRVFNLPTEHNYVLVLTNFTASGEFHSLKQAVICRLATTVILDISGIATNKHVDKNTAYLCLFIDTFILPTE